MRTVTVTERQDAAGTIIYAALLAGQPIMADTTDRAHAMEFARATFEQLRAPATLNYWNATTGTTTDLETKGGR